MDNIGLLKRTDLTTIVKIWRRCDPENYTKAITQIIKRKPTTNLSEIETIKQKFESIYGKIKVENRWVFIGLIFKIIYPEAYKEDIKEFSFNDGFGKRMSELLQMKHSNFSKEFKTVRFNISIKDSDLRKKIDEVFEKLI